MKHKDKKLNQEEFFSKNVIFNSDSKTITFFKLNNNKSANPSIEKPKSNGLLLILSYVFIGVLFLFVGLYFGRKLCIIRRKKKANELVDSDYEYVPSINEDKNYALVDL